MLPENHWTNTMVEVTKEVFAKTGKVMPVAFVKNHAGDLSLVEIPPFSERCSWEIGDAMRRMCKVNSVKEVLFISECDMYKLKDVSKEDIIKNIDNLKETTEKTETILITYENLTENYTKHIDISQGEIIKEHDWFKLDKPSYGNLVNLLRDVKINDISYA